MRVIFMALVAALSFATPGLAQSFQVRPLLVEGDVNPGTIVEIPIQIAPTTFVDEQILDVQVVQLAQSSSGSFLAVDYTPGTETPRSAAAWITAPPQILLDPPEVTTLTLTMDVPLSARGNYAAGILISARPPEDAVGLRVTVRLLVPIIVGTEGRVVRQDVRMADASLRYEFPEPERPGQPVADLDAEPETTFVDAVIENNGGTFSRFRGDIWVDVADDTGTWRQVRRVNINETRLLPETAIALPVNLGRLLPSGDYRIRGELYVDGRRTAPLTREISFDGHPSVGDLLTDVVLPLEPSVFEFDYAPRATRTGIITIENPAISPIEVDLSVALPQGMVGRSSQTVRDTDISAVDWVMVSPTTFQLRPGQSRNLRVVARFPDEDAAQQNYYAEISAEARYLDGQSAGSASGLVEVRRPDGENSPALAITPVQFSETDAVGVYALSLRADNSGDVLLSPTIAYVLADETGEPILEGGFDSDIDAPLLPLEGRSYGGQLDISGLAEGTYTLLATATNGVRSLGTLRVAFTIDEDRVLQVVEAE